MSFDLLWIGEKLAVYKDFLVCANGQSRTPVPTGFVIILLFLPQSIGNLTLWSERIGEFPRSGNGAKRSVALPFELAGVSCRLFAS